MKNNNYLSDMLEMLDRPAFCVSNGIITEANQAAISRFVQVGDSILPMLISGQEEYSVFTDGCLYLSLNIGSQPYDASVTKVDDMDIFALDVEDVEECLRPLALAAREIREPLNRVFFSLDELMSELNDQQKVQDKTGQIYRGLYQILRLVNNMSSSATPMRVHLELRNVTSVAQEFFDQAAQLCANAGVELIFDNHSAPIYSLIDTDLLERGLYNIISNALKNMPSGGIIETSLSRRGNQIIFTISDSGSGIDPAISSSVFYRYLREPRLESVTQGIGLGMKLVSNCASAHGGTVLLRSKKNVGAVVSLCLPIHQKTNALGSHPLRVESTGNRCPALIELSDSLPNELYIPYPKK